MNYKHHMKSLLLIPVFYLFGILQQEEERCYYFGLSRPTKTDAVFNIVLYSDIKDTLCDSRNWPGLSAKWTRLVNNICGNANECTSDLNYYTTKEQAEKNLNDALKKYGKQYKLEKINF